MTNASPYEPRANGFLRFLPFIIGLHLKNVPVDKFLSIGTLRKFQRQ
jgi:hypothetical protein